MAEAVLQSKETFTFLRPRVLLAMVLILCFTGCGTLHPRSVADFREHCRGMDRVGVLPPYIKVGVKYYDTGLYIYSASKSEAFSAALAKQMQTLLVQKGYDGNLHQYDDQTPVSREEVQKLIGEAGAEPAVPFGMPHAFLRQGDLQYVQQIFAAEKIINQVITGDPDYNVKELAVGMAYPGPYDDLAEYDLVLVLYGTMRCETNSEYYVRWSRNIGFNLITLPLTVVATLMPFAFPFVSSTPTFFSGSPDASWLALLAFEPKTGHVVFMNDYFFEGMLLETGVKQGIEKLLRPLPTKDKG